jgi:PAS domain S-box-containing protein
MMLCEDNGCWMRRENHWLLQVAGHLGITATYVVAANLGFLVAIVHPVVASVWPPAGLALAVLLLFGPRWWPGIFVGALVANALMGIPLPAATVIAVGNTLAAAWGASTLRRLDFQLGLHRIRDALVLIGFGALCAPLIAATIGTLSLHLAANAPADHLAAIWLNWWSGDSIGVMLVTPLLAVWMRRHVPDLTGRQIAEMALLVASLLMVSVVLTGVLHGYKYAIFPLVSWAAIRYGPRGASLATVLVAAVAIWHTVQGVGPFIGTGGEGLWRLQLFLALLTTGSLVVGAMAGALRASELRFRRMFEHAGVGIVVVQADGRIAEANPAFHGMLRFSPAELAGRTLADITHQDDWAVDKTIIRELYAGQLAPYRVVKRYLRKDGTLFWGKLTATHIPDGGDGPGCSIGLVEDISEQRAAEEALARDEEELRRTTQLLQTLIDAAPLAILAVDPQGCVRSWNHAAEQMFGWSAAEVIGQIVPFVPPQALEAFRSSLRGVLDGEALTGLQVRRNRRDGIVIDLRICAAPTRAPDGTVDGIIVIAEDVTERKSLGEQLKQAQKMEAIGQLTGGIAHDFNNILTIVMTNATLLADQIALDQMDMRGEVTDLQRAALRGAELVRKLMTFSRRRDLELSPVNLADVLGDAERALRRLLPKSIDVSSQIADAGPFTVEADVGAIEQILFNLATNGRDAMPEGGTLRLAVYRAWLDQEHRRTHGWGTPGEYIVIAVSDTGCGMSPETRGRVFEPFFTTKEVGKGTGLGMAMVYGLVKQHNGYIGVYSEPGHGTTFRLYFPAVTACTQAWAAPADPAASVGGTERILIVDDEDGIRRSAGRVLRRSGYVVEEAADGEKALALLGTAENPFDLVLSDLVMPRMGGLALRETVLARGDGTRVLLMSGYTTEDVRALRAAQPGLGFLHKPWTVTDLLRRVRGILDEPAITHS